MSIDNWDEAAAEYSSFLREGHDRCRLIYEPAVLELLGDVNGKRVLDLGCGEGYWARKLAALGAEVICIDGSSELIRLAKESDPHSQIPFLVGDLLAPLQFPSTSFDLVLANMVLMDLPAIGTAVSESARVLIPGGTFIFSITHPCFFVPDWVTDGKGRKIHKTLSDYLHEQQIPIHVWGTTMHYHRPLSAYFAALESSGLRVESLREPVPSEETLREHPEWEFHCRIPSFLVIKATAVPF